MDGTTTPLSRTPPSASRRPLQRASWWTAGAAVTSCAVQLRTIVEGVDTAGGLPAQTFMGVLLPELSVLAVLAATLRTFSVAARAVLPWCVAYDARERGRERLLSDFTTSVAPSGPFRCPQYPLSLPCAAVPRRASPLSIASLTWMSSLTPVLIVTGVALVAAAALGRISARPHTVAAGVFVSLGVVTLCAAAIAQGLAGHVETHVFVNWHSSIKYFVPPPWPAVDAREYALATSTLVASAAAVAAALGGLLILGAAVHANAAAALLHPSAGPATCAGRAATPRAAGTVAAETRGSSKVFVWVAVVVVVSLACRAAVPSMLVRGRPRRLAHGGNESPRGATVRTKRAFERSLDMHRLQFAAPIRRAGRRQQHGWARTRARRGQRYVHEVIPYVPGQLREPHVAVHQQQFPGRCGGSRSPADGQPGQQCEATFPGV